MATVFTMIIDGDLPGRFVWRDATCVAFLSINSLTVGHTLVVPRAEVDHWLDLDAPVTAHCMDVARTIGTAQMQAFSPERVGLIIAGFEVPHTHVHVFPIWTMSDLDFANAAVGPDPVAMDDAAQRLRVALVALGHVEANG